MAAAGSSRSTRKCSARSSPFPPAPTAQAQDGDLVAVETTRAPRLGLPTGRVVERLGSLQSERAVSLIAIHAHGIPHVFRRETQTEAEAAKPATLAHREDWRHVPFVTIDPPDAKDHDDAVHAEPDTAPNNRGGFIVSVAIADVAHYVTPGSALDREALVRGNSVYFPDRVVPMLPERISNDLCSLRPREDRAALAVRMVIGADGRKRSHTFPPRHDALGRAASPTSRRSSPSAGAPTRTPRRWSQPVLEPLYAAYEALARARSRARAARSRPARAQDPAQGRRHGRPRHHAGAAGSAPADRGVHDPRQCGRRRDAGEGARAADLSRARRAGDGEGRRVARIPRTRSTSASQGRRAARRRRSTASSPA